MTQRAKKRRGTFDALPEPERQKVARENLPQTALAKHVGLRDGRLVALADEVFRELDRCDGDGSVLRPYGRWLSSSAALTA